MAEDTSTLLDALNEIVSLLHSTIDKWEPLSSQLASSVESKAMQHIFPECQKKPFSLQTLSCLIIFLHDPESAERQHIICLPGAAAAWRCLPENKQNRVLLNYKIFTSDNPGLLYCINVLKENNGSTVGEPKSPEQIVSYYKTNGDEDFLDALWTCSLYLKQNLSINN